MILRQTKITGFFLSLGVVALLSGCATSEKSNVNISAVPANPTPTLLEARRAKSDPAISYLTYQHMDQLFGTQKVAASKNPEILKKADGFDDSKFMVTGSKEPLAFDEYIERERINAIVVMRDGKIVKEAYRNGSNENTKFISMSASKSIISLLVGFGIEDGSISSLDNEITKYLPELKNTAYEGVTLKNLLMMRSGTDWNEALTRGSHRDLSLNQAKAYYEDAAYKLKRINPPGTKFNYSTLDANLVGLALERATGRSLAEYMSEKLWRPAGMESSAFWVEQGVASKPRPFYGAGFSATVRDFARIGQLMLNNGKVANRQVVPESWIKESIKDYNHSPGYGYFWWIDRSNTKNNGTFGAYGMNGQAIFVDPTSKTVIAAAAYWPNKKMTESQSKLFDDIMSRIH
ncbi:serine hydrolase domain-containing protein [Advenella incenata]